MASRIAGVGFVTVSLRRSIMGALFSVIECERSCAPATDGLLVEPLDHLMREQPNEQHGDETETLSVLAPIARSSIVDAVVDRIRGEILAGRLAAGARLPSERELSLALGINRLTLRAALARLEAVGLIITRHCAGTVVASWRGR